MGCSEQDLPNAVYLERTSHRVSCCLPECASVVRGIPEAGELVSQQTGLCCLPKAVSEPGLEGDSNHQGEAVGTGVGVRVGTWAGRSCTEAAGEQRGS